MQLLQIYPIKNQQQKPLVLLTQISANPLCRKILQRISSCCVGLKIQLILTNLKTRLKCYRTQRVSCHRKRKNRDYVNASLNPLHYGWEMSSEGYYRPIPTKAAIAPAGMLNLICCNCSVEVENPCQYLRCSCRKYGFKCLPACGQCHGLSCTNAPTKQ